MKILFYLQHFDPLIQTDLLKLNLIVFADDTMMNKYKSSFKTNSLGLFLVLLIIYYTNMGMLTNDILQNVYLMNQHEFNKPNSS